MNADSLTQRADLFALFQKHCNLVNGKLKESEHRYSEKSEAQKEK